MRIFGGMCIASMIIHLVWGSHAVLGVIIRPNALDRMRESNKTHEVKEWVENIKMIRPIKVAGREMSDRIG